MARTTRPKSKPRKADNDRNPEGLDDAIARHLKKKQTPEYAAQWRERMGLKE